MLEIFKKEIEALFDMLHGPLSKKSKMDKINTVKKKLHMIENQSFGDIYYFLQGKCKEKGVVYTPAYIACFMVRSTIESKDIISNPFIKILDPACGCGNLLIPCYEYLYSLYFDNLELINEKNNLSLTKNDISSHIIKNNLFGFDIDKTSIMVLSIDLFEKAGCFYSDKLLISDFLFDENYLKYDFILCNPPYIGKKSLDKAYGLKLKENFSNIYNDKGDVSYCFYAAAFESLEADGRMTFISSRYFMESPSGMRLREMLQKTSCIKEVIDFYGIRPFKNVGIDPVIITCQKSKPIDERINVKRPASLLKNDGEEFILNISQSSSAKSMNSFSVKQSSLDNIGWRLVNDEISEIIYKIESKCILSLSNICNSYQGIITGCDKAFIVSESEIQEHALETDIIRPWIKSSQINNGRIQPGDKYIIYANLITDIDNYPNCMSFISNYKVRLENRRECLKGSRQWYQLQWGREQRIFENEKIVFPYKSSNNRFALDKGSYFSADVYCLELKENSKYSLKDILRILNTSIYEAYYKCFAKKLGMNLFEYYPNQLLRLKIPSLEACNFKKEEEVYDYFNLNEMEVKKLIKYL